MLRDCRPRAGGELALALCAAVMMLSPAPVPRAVVGRVARGRARSSPNYDLGAQWTSAKVGKLVFDTTVTPRWLQTSDRFWYTYQTRDGRRFYLVDPVKKTKAPLFDHAKMAAALTSITRSPYDAQHLPFTNVRFVKNDTAFEFDVQVPRDAEHRHDQDEDHDRLAAAGRRRRGLSDATSRLQQQLGGTAGRRGGRGTAAAPPPRNETLHFEYDLATATVTLDEDYTAPAAQAALGHALARRADGRLRPQSQPLHDGRGELRQGAEERRTTRRSSKRS